MTKPYSEKTAQEIDERVHLLIEKAYNRAKTILKEHYDNVEKLAKLLLEREVIFTEDVRNILGERPFSTEEPVADEKTTSPVDSGETSGNASSAESSTNPE